MLAAILMYNNLRNRSGSSCTLLITWKWGETRLRDNRRIHKTSKRWTSKQTDMAQHKRDNIYFILPYATIIYNLFDRLSKALEYNAGGSGSIVKNRFYFYQNLIIDQNGTKWSSTAKMFKNVQIGYQRFTMLFYVRNGLKLFIISQVILIFIRLNKTLFPTPNHFTLLQYFFQLPSNYLQMDEYLYCNYNPNNLSILSNSEGNLFSLKKIDICCSQYYCNKFYSALYGKPRLPV